MLAVAAAERNRTSGAIVSIMKPDVCAPIDANGNLTSDGTRTYHWNALNQLVEVKEGSNTIATFEYDGEGRPTEKVAAGLTHQYIYDAEDIAEERLSGSSSDTIRYYHGAGIDEPLARKNSSEVVTYYLADHLGSVVQETNASGAVSLERDYGPWGDLLSGASTGHRPNGSTNRRGLLFTNCVKFGPPANAIGSSDAHTRRPPHCNSVLGSNWARSPKSHSRPCKAYIPGVQPRKLRPKG